jgi:hypothetical protein
MLTRPKTPDFGRTQHTISRDYARERRYDGNLPNIIFGQVSTQEVDQVIAAARKVGRHSSRDATLIL